MENLVLEKTLWQALKEDFKFNNHVIVEPTNLFNKIKMRLHLSYKVKERVVDDWLTAEINGNQYEVLMVDIWYVQLWKNGELIFDKRPRFGFKNSELLNLIQ